MGKELLTKEEIEDRNECISEIKDIVDAWIRLTGVTNWQQWDLSSLVRYLGQHCTNTIDRLLTVCYDRNKYLDRPCVLIYNGCGQTPMPDIWLLVWRKGNEGPEGTDIHDHNDSEVGIYVYKGAVREKIHVFKIRDYKLVKTFNGVLPFRQVERWAKEGSSLTIGSPYIHTVEGCPAIDMSVTIHAYYPPLDEMVLFREEGNVLVPITHWVDGRKDCDVKR